MFIILSSVSLAAEDPIRAHSFRNHVSLCLEAGGHTQGYPTVHKLGPGWGQGDHYLGRERGAIMTAALVPAFTVYETHFEKHQRDQYFAEEEVVLRETEHTKSIHVAV